MLVRPTQAVEIFRNISIRHLVPWYIQLKTLRRMQRKDTIVLQKFYLQIFQLHEIYRFLCKVKVVVSTKIYKQ